MARGITQNDVNEAADALLLASERPTVDRIRQHLGTGSPNTVARMLDVWWKSLGPRLSAQQRKIELPAAPEPVALLASQLWEQALACAKEHAEAAITLEREALAKALQAAEARISTAESVTGAAREAEARAAQALATAHQRLNDRQALVDRQSAQIDDLSRQREEVLKLGQQLQAEVLALRDRAQALQAEHESAREAQAAHLRAVEDRAHVEVDRARQEARELKQQLQAADKAHAARVRQLEFDLSQVQTGSAQLARELAAEQARRETLEAQQTELRRSLDAALKPTPALRAERTRTKAKPVRPTKR